MKKIVRFFTSVGFGTRGLFRAWKNEMNLRLEIIAALVAVIASILLKISLIGVAIIILTSTLVISLELLNTMIELVSDVLKPRLNHYVAQIKDMTAAAVIVAALGSLGVAACLLVPPIVHLLWR